MDSALAYLNKTHCLVKVKSGWVVCKFSGQGIYLEEDGEFIRMADKKDKTKWKRFREAMRYTSSSDFEIGEMVDADASGEAYYVVDTGVNPETKDRCYIIGK